MKIAVLVKDVPDTYGDRKLNLETGLVERGVGERILDEISERALEVALSYADGNRGADILLISMAPAEATASIRKGLAMGAASAIQIVDAALVGADAGTTAEALAAVIRREAPDLVIAGNSSTDGGGGVVPAMVAEFLGWPHVTALGEVRITDDRIEGIRRADASEARIAAALPAVASITEALPDARFANFKGILAAKKKPFDTVTLADLGVRVLDPEAARTVMVSIAERPPRAAGMKADASADAAAELAEFLADHRLI